MPRKKNGKSQKKVSKTMRSLNNARKDFASEVGVKILTASKVKELIKTMGMRCSKDFPDHLAKEVYLLVWKATKRTLANDRKTINGTDL